MNITVFGGSTPTAGERSYEEALDLGRSLAKTGHVVFTGGYSGTMEAVSRGAAEAGGHTVGITCEEIDKYRPGGPNQWVLEERTYKSLKSRLYALIEVCDAALALPGGIGTLAEISAMWSQIQVSAIAERPLILIGKGWKKTFGALQLEQSSYISADHHSLLQYVDEAVDALAYLSS
jgi:uncharacterized protein (TIGR00730 family)